jgi:hypothetical protein
MSKMLLISTQGVLALVLGTGSAAAQAPTDGMWFACGVVVERGLRYVVEPVYITREQYVQRHIDDRFQDYLRSNGITQFDSGDCDNVTAEDGSVKPLYDFQTAGTTVNVGGKYEPYWQKVLALPNHRSDWLETSPFQPSKPPAPGSRALTVKIAEPTTPEPPRPPQKPSTVARGPDIKVAPIVPRPNTISNCPPQCPAVPK